MPGARIFKRVAIKLIEPITEDIPARCRLKMAMSTEEPGWPIRLDKGGYRVQPVPTPPSMTLERISKENAGGNIQKLKLFIRGKDISTVPV
jgi:predicted transcriptional regulator of viral defense system